MTSETDALSSDRQLKTLVLTDLCDSVALTARIGDAAAAELFRALDVRALQLLQRWKGRLIDRSDGMFLLFDVPTQGLGFALDYLDALAEIGKQRKLPLQARIGIHVGDVLFWRNDEDAVAAGAKPVDVEGVAKPTAARLMALARPNQILLSSVAEALLRPSQRDLGERGASLQWKSHGRWYFKGLPTPQEVFEVGAAGSAPLRMPPRSNKAWRRLPLWRRPAALVAELLLVVAVGAVAWVLVRPEPAIAFAERDWVVIGDFTNQTGNLVLDDALQQALRISLEQSRHVNVVSDLKVRETLRQMRKDPAQPLDRATAKEVAIRDGARAVVMPSVQEVHGKLRVSMDVVDPGTGRVVYSEYADGSGLDSALNSLDKVAAAIRLRLGEGSEALSQASLPLPRVATSNLDALHVYAAAQLAYGQADAQKSLDYYEVATRLDPKFAMAYLGQMRSLVSLAQLDEARSRFSLAEGLRDRLSARQALYMDAWKSELYGGNEVTTFRAWKMLADLYPDHHAASANLALAALSLGRYSEAERAMERVNVPQVEFPSAALLLHGRVQLVQGKQEEAVVSLREAMVLAEGRGNRYLVGALAAGGQFEQARDVLLKLPQGNPGGWLEGTSLALDEMHSSKALAGVDAAAMQCGDDTAECDVLAVVRIASHAAAGSCVSAAQIRTVLKPLLDKAAMPQQLDRGPRLYYAAALIYSAQRMGLADTFEVERGALERVALDIRDPRATELIALVEANAVRLSGGAKDALPKILAMVNGGELFQVHSALAAAYRDVGDEAGFARESIWLKTHRGRAYAEYAGSSTLQTLNVVDSKGTPAPNACNALARIAPDVSVQR